MKIVQVSVSHLYTQLHTGFWWNINVHLCSCISLCLCLFVFVCVSKIFCTKTDPTKLVLYHINQIGNNTKGSLPQHIAKPGVNHHHNLSHTTTTNETLSTSSQI